MDLTKSLRAFVGIVTSRVTVATAEHGRIKIKRDKIVWDKCLRTKVHPLIKDDEVAWWIDSGATTHVCKDREWFTTYEQVQDGSVLHMGNESTAPILGHGKVVLEFSSGKTLISKMYLMYLELGKT
ncbi:uncharacterized protein LOC130495144 [Raphanus sativus]|uniref:Uncharacterized protein LOC130495144 n=1 Tax=Raphanus sativus TaxID=3726 RepID=A0A9W3BSS1_RAPSA|nr:uncharacterized protein LOC130495144 [Raphanus sativus]